MKSVARATLSVLAAPGVASLFRPFMKERATIFMLHRFQSPEFGVMSGHRLDVLREGLGLLRRRKFEVVSLDELFRRLSGEGPPPDGAIAFTIDDGYREQVLVAGRIFAEFDCPVTTFVTSGFLDRRLWFWWDRIAYVFRQTARTRVEMRWDGQPLTIQWSTDAERAKVQSDFIARCTTIPDPVKHEAIADLAQQAEVDLPAQPPFGSEPVSWDELRAAERLGMTFGPHTVTHPILSQTTPEVSEFELRESWRRLSSEAANPVKVFCYPNGGARDFGSREVSTLRNMDFRGAVVGLRGYPARYAESPDVEAPFRVRRMEYPVESSSVVRFVSGMERLNLALRGYESPS